QGDRGRLASAGRTLLEARQLTCPSCDGVLAPHGRGRTRTVRGVGVDLVTVTPRRARCGSCAATPVLLPAGPRTAPGGHRRGDRCGADRGGTRRWAPARSRPGWAVRSPRSAAGCGGREGLTQAGCV